MTDAAPPDGDPVETPAATKADADAPAAPAGPAAPVAPVAPAPAVAGGQGEYQARGRSSIVSEFWDFIWENKAFWLAPILIVLLLLIVLVVFGGSAAGPFVYTLF